MKVKERSVSQLAGGKVRFYVPPFQRKYAWGVREFQHLWDDICLLLDGEKNRHFMGTIVLEPLDAEGKVAVIDGQQRLGTFTVILKVLSIIAGECGSAFKRQINANLSLRGERKFVPALDDDEAYNWLLENPTILQKVKHRNVRACFLFFDEAIRAYMATASGAKVYAFNRLASVVLDQLFFIRITLTSKDDAQAIFETINYTGVPLTAADLARNFVLAQAKNLEDQQRLNREYWQKIEKAIQEAVYEDAGTTQKGQFQKILPEFLRAVLTVEKQQYISFSDLYRHLRLFFGSGQIEDKLKTTLEYANLFSVFNNPLNEKSAKLRAQLMRFKHLRMTTHYPVMLILYSEYSRGKLRLADLLLCMKYIESFVVRRAFNSKVSRDLNLQFANVAKELCTKRSSARLPAVLRHSLSTRRWPTDHEFRQNFVSSPIYATAPAIARFTLFGIEWNEGNQHELESGKKIQVEHVFPQQPGKGWTVELPGLKRNLHAIGNLSLTAYNQKYSNHSFKEKMNGPNGLRKSPFWLNKMMTNVDEWTEASVLARSRRLLTRALKIWPGPGRVSA